MSKIFQLEGGQYEHPNEYKLVSTVRGTTILQPEFGTVIIEGDVIEASTHNTIQKNGVLASKVNVTMESTDTVLVPTDMTIESPLFNELKILLLFETGTTLPSNSFIKLKETNVPIANVNDYIVNANTPLLFLYFDSKFYAYKAGSGTSTGATETTSGIAQIATQNEVNAGTDDTKIVTSKKLKTRLDSLLAGITSTYVKLTQLATETVAGIIKISTTSQVAAGIDNSTAVSPAKLKELYTAGSAKTQNGYQKLPSGVIMQWGMVAGNNGLVNATFPVAFPTSCANLQITSGGGSGGESFGVSVIISMSNTGFTAALGFQEFGNADVLYYVAIGY